MPTKLQAAIYLVWPAGHNFTIRDRTNKIVGRSKLGSGPGPLFGRQYFRLPDNAKVRNDLVDHLLRTSQPANSPRPVLMIEHSTPSGEVETAEQYKGEPLVTVESHNEFVAERNGEIEAIMGLVAEVTGKKINTVADCLEAIRGISDPSPGMTSTSNVSSKGRVAKIDVKTGGSAKQRKHISKIAALLAQESKPLSVATIAERTKIAKADVAEAMSIAVTLGILTTEDGKNYKIAEDA